MSKARVFWDYVDPRGINVVRLWLDALPTDAQGQFDRWISHLEAAPTLARPYSAALTGPCKGLMEIRIRSEGVEYRLLYCDGPGRGNYTLLVGIKQRGSKRELHSACARALRLRPTITERGRARPHEFG